MTKPTPPSSRFESDPHALPPNTPRLLRVLFAFIFVLGALAFFIMVGFQPVQIVAVGYLVGSGIMLHGSCYDNNSEAHTGFGVVVGSLCLMLIMKGMGA
jgi:hypothetical protein